MFEFKIWLQQHWPSELHRNSGTGKSPAVKAALLAGDYMPAHPYKRLQARGLDGTQAWKSASNGRGPWWNAGASHMNAAYPAAFFRHLGAVSITAEHRRLNNAA